MKGVHTTCVQYSTEENGYINYVESADVAGLMKVTKAMMVRNIL